MENKPIQPAAQDESKDKRTAWITPAIVDYDIEEATRGTTVNALANDGVAGYS